MRNVDAWLARIIQGVPFLRRFGHVQGRLASFGEQGLQGLANMGASVILARSLSHEGFATIGMMLGTHFFVFGVHRTAIVLPFILDAGDDPHNIAAVEQRWWWLNLLSVAVVAGLLLIATGLVYRVLGHDPHARWFREGLALSVFVTPALLLFEFERRVLYHLHRPVAAALCSALYLTLNIGCALLYVRGHPTPAHGSLAWISGAVGGAMLGMWFVPPQRPRLREGLRAWWPHRHFALLQSLSIIPNAFYDTSATVLVGTFGGAAPAAAFTATRSLANPAVSMTTAVDSMDKLRASRALATGGLAGLIHSIVRTRRLLALVTGSYLGLLMLLAGPVQHLAFGNVYGGEVWPIRIMAMALFLMCVNQPSETLLIMLRESRLMLATRIIAAITMVALLATLRHWGTTGACLALLGTHVVNLSALLVAERIAARRWRVAQDHPDPVLA